MTIKKSLLITGLLCTISGTGIEPVITSASANPGITIAQNQRQNTQPTELRRRLRTRSLSPQPSPSTTVKLIAPGIQPRQQLRFSPKVGQKEIADMEMNMDMSMSLNGNSAPSVKIPGTKIQLNAVVNQVQPNGDFQYEFTYSNVDVVGESDLPPAILESMRGEMKKMEGFKGTAIVDSMGRTKKANFTVPPNFDPSLKQMMDQMASSIEQMSAQVPQEAIGKGAKWQVTSQVSMNGINIQQTATYELLDIQNGVVTMNVSFAQQIPGAQKMILPQMPPGMTMTLQSYNATGTGQTKISLGRIMPLSTSIDMKTTAQMQANSPDLKEPMVMDQEMSMRMKIESN